MRQDQSVHPTRPSAIRMGDRAVACARAALAAAAGWAIVSLATAADPPTSQPVSVSVQRSDAGFRLIRDGKPYRIRGVGGRSRLEDLVAAGGNSIRTWHIGDAGRVLDRAHELGLTVTVGLWLEHERHGFDYSDKARVAAQHEKILAAVRAHRDHPALLMWGIGNEMEGDGTREEVWQAVNHLARAIKRIDPHHPTMTVVAGTGNNRIRQFVAHCPDIDVLGVNAYGDLRGVPKQLAEQGLDRPYVLTEFGPFGWWEVAKTSWGAELEPTSTAKAETYLASYRAAVLDQPARCLGAYAFLWGHKQEHTHTWFGMYLPTGERTAAVDVMSKMWTGDWPANRAPVITRFALETLGDAAPDNPPEFIVKPGARLRFRVAGDDPDGDETATRWELRRESTDKRSGGDREEPPAAISNAFDQHDAETCTLAAPAEAGPYRLFVFLTDGKGAAATANIPFLVK